MKAQDSKLRILSEYESFLKLFYTFSKDCFNVSVNHGFEDDFNEYQKLAWIHSEVSEVFEVLRKSPNKPSAKIPTTQLAEELADIIILTVNLSIGLQVNIGPALIHKLIYNNERPYKHDEKSYDK